MINSFSGEYEFLSNFFPVDVIFDGHIYDSVEHAYQAAKTLDEDERELIRSAPTAGKAKRLGRKITIRNDWDKVKEEIMLDLLKQKFEHPDLRELLLNTGDLELIEGNNWGDTFWGVCNGKGKNRLGIILMGIRQAIRDGDY